MEYVSRSGSPEEAIVPEVVKNLDGLKQPVLVGVLAQVHVERRGVHHVLDGVHAIEHLDPLAAFAPLASDIVSVPPRIQRSCN